MKIAFCITCKGRLPHLKVTLAKNILDNAGANSVFVLLSYGSDGELDDFIKANFRDAIEAGKLAYYQHKDATKFKMTHAKNMAHRCAILEEAGVLVNLDADNIAGEGFADYLDELFERTKSDPQEIFLWSRMIKGAMPRGVSGRIAVSRNAFLISGGYDEKYEKHSPDDRDFNVRLRRLGYCAQEVDGGFLSCIPHTDKLRYREYPDAPDAVYQICQISRVVNNGNIGCGAVFRNFDAVPIILSRIPTRIFGIGMHKTATTSLHNAFEILGFKSGHWENAHWAKAVWTEMSHIGKSLHLERFYALSDIPVSQLYRELDQAYPNSKFILTVRDEEDWLHSVKNHFDGDVNLFQKVWDKDPFTNKMHSQIYGRKKFDAAVFLSAYRRHNADVMDYFKGRPDDLLIMDMSKKQGWKELCLFLNAAIPSQGYPMKNTVEERNYFRTENDPENT
jgi:hypothetical protein